MDKTITRIISSEPIYKPEYDLYFLLVACERNGKTIRLPIASRSEEKLKAYKPGDKF
ncbi:hypothetical protein PPK16_gp41 [Bacillus phage 049ML001]|uniref:Uncharacterized protein n=1 Tax=Bacillus phage 049ML001 TaxID=2601660 RepID=A0A5P8PI39_9CAUD|nr:hypothetical protein PPK16_gp41 [Bacillus phage 049ML001]QFR56344.1 hypothetical protein 049ML001_41 [Bacillus phage 049ML001]QFR56424.1 hypothetical protein 049ML003_41 [Bacillus phage 049ML003]